MINLLPDNEKIKIKKEYRNKILIIILTISAVVFSLSLVLLVPSLLFARAQSYLIERNTETVKKVSVAKDQEYIKKTASDINYKVSIVESSPENYIFSDSLNNIISSKISGVQITGVFFEKQDKKGEITNMFEIRGTANKREDLINFAKELESRKYFAKINLPVSNYVKDRDIEFNVQATANN